VSVEERLVAKGYVEPEDLVLARAERAAVPALPLNHANIPAELWSLASSDFWSRVRVVPVSRIGDHLVVAAADPLAFDITDQIEHATGLTPFIVAAPPPEIDSLTGKSEARRRASAGIAMESVMAATDDGIEVATSAADSDESLEAALEKAEEAPVIRMVQMMLIEALRTQASDIHFEAMEKTSRLRYRIDGVLRDRPAPPKSLHNAIVSRVKILSDLDIAERRLPQDGRFKVRAFDKEVDIRVSILPTIHGEKIVMRTLDKSNLAANLSSLGLDEFAFEAMKYAIDQPHGIILVTGPTGSGKTTTLYSCLQELNEPDVNIVTVEDPVEYQLEGVNQVHVNTQVGLTFAEVLRSVLRQDPDIVLVGEIRDAETADVAVKAALTGHLVLSTLHTNDAPGAVVRLIDMEVPPFMIASAVILAQAQRLYRKLCTACKTASAIDKNVLRANRIDPDFFGDEPIFNPVGCNKCNNIGFRGRGALMEVLPMSDILREGVMRGATSGELRDIGIEQGMVTLKECGLLKVRDGITSLAAALEVTGGD